MVDIPERTESHGPVFIYGVEGEQIEEENDAYNDLRYDIGELRQGEKVVVVAVLYWVSRNFALHWKPIHVTQWPFLVSQRITINSLPGKNWLNNVCRASQGLWGRRDGRDNAFLLPSSHIWLCLHAFQEMYYAKLQRRFQGWERRILIFCRF